MNRHSRKISTSLLITIFMLLSLLGVATAMTLGAHETTRWTNVHDGPGGPALAGVALAPNTVVNVVDYDGGGNWAQVASEIANGWIPSNALRAVGGAGSDGATGDCVIPDSGPWPACATGGSSPGGASDGCLIPDSGPWPPCATDGSPPPSQTPDSVDCVIPESGPWPACATDGNSNEDSAENSTPESANKGIFADFKISNIRITDNGSQKITIYLDYTGLPRDVLTLLGVRDLNSCHANCDESPEYTINGGMPFFDIPLHAETIEDFVKFPEEGSVSFELGINHLHCIHQTMTTQLHFFVSGLPDNSEDLERGVYYPEVEFAQVNYTKAWCAD